MTHRTHLLIIDPQNDFCDLPQVHCPAPSPLHPGQTPALPVPGAHADMQRLSTFIRQHMRQLTHISTTLDSHHRIDIAHPGFWCQANGAPLTPFTTITAAQVRQGEYRPRASSAMPRVLAYLDTLQAQGRYTLMVWPVHCEIGTWGHNVHADVQSACSAWEEMHLDTVHHVSKGTNPWTEHYSAIQAEVPDASDPETQTNRALIEQLDQADLLLIAGQASSHCVKASTEHIVQSLPSGHLHKIVLLTDCMSPVTGFEMAAQAFLQDMKNRGVRLARSSDMNIFLSA